MSVPPSVAAYRRWSPLWLDLAADIHPGRWAGLGVSAEAAARLAACPRSRRRLSRGIGWLEASAGDDWRPWDAAPGEVWNWALLPGADLWRIGLRLGAGRYRAEASRLVLRAEVAAFTEAVGADAYRFALRQAALVWRDESLDDAGAAAGTLAERALAAAGLGLGCWLAELPAGLAARVRLKLPPGCDRPLAAAAAWDPERRGAWLAVLRRLFALPRINNE